MNKTLLSVPLLAASLAAGPMHAADPSAKVLARAEMPEGFVVGSGDPPLGLLVELEGEGVGASAAAAPSAANVLASGVAGDGEATLSIRHDLEVSLKFDLYVSEDGERFRYASSCAVTPGISSFELWQHPVRAFALGNPRVVDAGKLACD
ncbi:hypothetical protein [Luteimonas vadosa]|uniref:Uncharacterized protein n=1 Tax=Luteimonas vadosa TaxID=1165507 RepID=A0ABP9DR17_9GAMM